MQQSDSPVMTNDDSNDKDNDDESLPADVSFSSSSVGGGWFDDDRLTNRRTSQIPTSESRKENPVEEQNSLAS